MYIRNVIYNIRWYVLVVLAFCMLFAFRVPLFGNAAYLSLFLFFLLLFTSSRALNNFLSLIKDKLFILVLTLYLFAILFSAFTTTINNAFDFTFITPLINGFFSVIAIASLVSILSAWQPKHSVIDLLVWLLIIQVTIMFLMLFLPDLRDLIQNIVRTENEMERMASYQGIRGLGISGSVAFGMSVTMGTLGFVLHYWFAHFSAHRKTFVTFLIFLFCLVASLAAGRTAILGYALGFFIYLGAYPVASLVIRSWKYIVVSLLLGVAILLYIVSNEVLLEIATTYSRYVFQFVWRYLETGEATVTSLQHLEKMYFIPPKENWWFGDGYFSFSDGTHYMETDAGYMRFLLYFGVVGSVFMYLSFLIVSILFAWRNHSVMPSCTLFYVLFVLMAFILHYKGDTVFYNVPFMKIFFMISFYYLIKSKACSNYSDNKQEFTIGVSGAR